MNEISYIGEHLWVGRVGHFSLLFSFVATVLSLISFFLATKHRNDIPKSTSWLQLGRISFYGHGLSLFTLIGVLFFAMYNHYYEYSYVFDHVSEDLPLKYILSAFWEGQEGSFMLWMFWHVILGVLMIRTAGKYEAPVMFTFAAAELILMSMILGIHIPWGEEAIKIGSNPTTLLRHMNEAPIFANADYLSLIKGRGMNPLLQNYWMTIHPPTLFLGFASTIIPFAYAFAGLWLGDHKEWLKQSLHWSLFSGAILGVGILMGSLWAYVALSFGGYWAWDPVENASLVPWITLVAGIHVHLISRNTGYATRSVYFFYLISFVLILYSTFLTRSGVLGDTSAHAFTEMGLEWQLVILVLFFLVSGMGLLLYRFKEIKNPEKEEELTSREFWMFIGALVLLFGAILIISSTSLPVFNKIMTWFNPAYEGRVIKDVVDHYNKYQLWIAIFIAILSGFSLFMRYGGRLWEEQKKKFATKMLVSLAVSAVLTYLSSLWLQYYSWQYWMMSFTGIFSMVANTDYLITVAKGNIKLAWSAMAHLGFGMMMVGILASGLNQKHISTNPFVFKGMFSDDDVKKYVQLIKGKPLFSQGHLITYKSDTLIDRERRYDILFEKLNDSMEVVESFTLQPNAMYSNDFSKVAAFNPDTKHYFGKDIFTCVVSLPPTLSSMEEAKKVEDSLKFENHTLALHDTLHIGTYVLEVKEMTFDPKNKDYSKHPHDAGISAIVAVRDTVADTTYIIEPALGMEGALMYHYPDHIIEAGLKVKLGENMLDTYFTPDDQLQYKEYTIKTGGNFDFEGYRIQLVGFEKEPKHKNYKNEAGDIAVGATLNVSGEGMAEEVAPIYVIRKNQPMSIKSYSGKSGLHIRFANIDPVKEEFTFKIAKDIRKSGNVDLAIAKDVPRTDYLILQATIFPGINLFWGGCILMMVGLLLAGWQRYKSLKRA